MMCFKNLFKPKPKPEIMPKPLPIPEPEPTPVPEPEPALTLPYPEQEPDYKRTINNTFALDVIVAWFKDYDVPIISQRYWIEDVDIEISLRYSYPAATGGGHIWLRPEWANSGVLAHEVCHIVWSDLTLEDRETYEALFNLARTTDELLKLAWDIKPYMRTNIVEAHADCYRYLGKHMPEVLKRFYPKLI